ncbi:GntR family transcriptional regulator [Streptomyces sp. NPDC005921]|uniref:GntR family transcriptional regulator n=1 Tax=Streptomyces sp. NPDC005827 TaxID=3157070 RepID=UPI0033FFC354
MARGATLVSKVSTDLRRAISLGEYAPGDRLPIEADLASTYGVSRATVRAALRQLEATSLVRTQHGVGTFVADTPAVRAGLERLDSISGSIRASGREAGMVYRSRTVRPLLPDEAAKMGLSAESSALEVRRSILADGEVVAYSYDLLPMSLLPEDFPLEELDGSIFTFLRERLDIIPERAIAEIHAVSSQHIGWGPDASSNSLYVLLDQLHYGAGDRLLLYSRTYFIEGRYAFTIVRST